MTEKRAAYLANLCKMGRGDMRELPRVDRADDMPGVWKSDRIM